MARIAGEIRNVETREPQMVAFSHSGDPRNCCRSIGHFYLLRIRAESDCDRFPLFDRCSIAVPARRLCIRCGCLCHRGSLLELFLCSPVFSFRVSDSSDIWALVSFLVAALIITRLTTQVRREAQTAELHRQEIKLLYQLAQRLLALDPRNEMLANSMAQFRAVFGLKAVCLYDGVNLELHHDGDVDGDLAIRTRATYISQRESDDAVMGIFTRPLVATGRIIGAVGFDGLRDAELTAGPLTTLAATVLERLHVFRDASQASAAAQVEEFRGTILDALAHEFKTPLASIVTAAGALRESAQLSPRTIGTR